MLDKHFSVVMAFSLYILRTGIIFRRRAGILPAAAADNMPTLHALSSPQRGRFGA
ncbi:MAG: hypothetical protein WCR46_21595 [Deltaproteobacteria bacterium]